MTQHLMIIGKSGQVASELQALCAASSIPYSIIDRTQIDLATLDNPDVISNLIEKHQATAILNAAAHTAVDQAESEPDLAMAINASAPGIMAHACMTADIPLVHVSTDFVFNGKTDKPYVETDPTAPLSVYGTTKRAGEQAIVASGCTHAILRTAWVFSPIGKNFVKTMLRLGAERDRLTIVADQHGCPTPARAIADAMITCAGQLIATPEKSGIYHFVGDEKTSWAGFARAIFDAANLTPHVEDIPTAQFPTPATRPAFSVLDCTHIAETFGIKQPNWRTALHDTIETLARTA